MKGGTINPFPEYLGSKYLGLRPPYYKDVVNKFGRLYYPPERQKSIPSYSVVNYNVDRCLAVLLDYVCTYTKKTFLNENYYRHYLYIGLCFA